MKGMILAAGYGTRMLPVTRFVPKALLPVEGRPLLEWNLRYLAEQGIEEAVVNAHHLAGEMRRWAISRTGRGGAGGGNDEIGPGGTSGATAGVDDEFLRGERAGKGVLHLPPVDGLPAWRILFEPEILGTGGGIANAAPWLDSDPVVVLNADQIFRPDLKIARATHEAGGFVATLVCVRDPRHAQVRCEGARAVAIERRPVFGDSDLLTFTGVYFLSRVAIDAIATAVRHEPPPPGNVESNAPSTTGPRPVGFLDIVPMFRTWMEGGRLGVHLFEQEPFLEAGSPEAYLELLREAPSLVTPERASSSPRPVVHGFGVIAPGATVAADAWVEESAILDGAVVESGARVVRSILGPFAVARGEVVRRIVAGSEPGAGSKAASAQESRDVRLLLPQEDEMLLRFLRETEPVLAGFRASLRLLQGDGSARRVVRVVCGGRSGIVVLPAADDPATASTYPRRTGPEIPDETATFVYIARYLARLGVPVPQVRALDAESRVLLLEDLGDLHLSDLGHPGRAGESGDAGSGNALSRAYDEVLEVLRRMQAPPAEAFDPSRTHNPDYDDSFILRYEAGYFLREMVRGHGGLEPADPAALDAELARAAHEALDGAPRVFMHRDFQSRNLMRTPRGLVVIDFQGGRLGPPEYDLAALVLDPYADLPAALRERLVESHLERAARNQKARSAARRRLRACGINRMMQTLGAFGYLGGRLHKPGFLEHAPAALVRLQELSRGDFPHLHALTIRLAERLNRETASPAAPDPPDGSCR